MVPVEILGCWKTTIEVWIHGCMDSKTWYLMLNVTKSNSQWKFSTISCYERFSTKMQEVIRKLQTNIADNWIFIRRSPLSTGYYLPYDKYCLKTWPIVEITKMDLYMKYYFVLFLLFEYNWPGSRYAKCFVRVNPTARMSKPNGGIWEDAWTDKYSSFIHV